MCFVLSGGSCCRLQTSGEKSETTSSNLNVNFLLILFISDIFVVFLFILMFLLINHMNSVPSFFSLFVEYVLFKCLNSLEENKKRR